MAYDYLLADGTPLPAHLQPSYRPALAELETRVGPALTEPPGASQSSEMTREERRAVLGTTGGNPVPDLTSPAKSG